MKAQQHNQFLFQAPARLESASDSAHSVLQLAALSGRLALEDRSNVAHTTGRAENVAEHSLMLAIVAPVLAEEFYPDLDANLVTRFATIHDAVEAYVGDTPTLRVDDTMLQEKYAREEKGVAQLLKEFADLPGFTKVISDYEDQKIPEARFVRMLDKIMPVAIHFNQGGSVLTGHSTAQDLKQRAVLKEAAFLKEYPDFERIIALRTELIDLAIQHLY